MSSSRVFSASLSKRSRGTSLTSAARPECECSRTGELSTPLTSGGAPAPSGTTP
jgi:hypothetical protein